jgi:hypothetical protein
MSAVWKTLSGQLADVISSSQPTSTEIEEADLIFISVNMPTKKSGV